MIHHYLDRIEDPKGNFAKAFYENFRQVFNYLYLAIKFESRKPRSQAVSSKYIYDLFTNRTKNVIKLKQRQSHTLNATVSIKQRFFLSMKHYLRS